MSKPNLSDTQILGSIAGEEDPGAALDVVRSMLKNERQKARQRAGQRIHMDYTEGVDVIGVDVGWPRRDAGTRAGQGNAAELLGLLVAHHGEIADTARSLFRRTGQRHIALEVGEDEDGVFYVNHTD